VPTVLRRRLWFPFQKLWRSKTKDAGLTSNMILPGTMDTPANRKAIPSADVSKWVQPAAVAELVVWLASGAGKGVNGSVIAVYGKDA
jgi:NAD(P)-dependent dehydrogenase (short-subunit alcohol dehydrogenase family)